VTDIVGSSDIDLVKRSAHSLMLRATETYNNYRTTGSARGLSIDRR
jgi:hypothetical protein